MKGFNTVVNVVLIVAVSILFYMQFGSGTKPAASSEDFKSVKIAFVKPDTIAEYYFYYQELMAEVEGLKKEIEEDLGTKSQNFQQQVYDFEQQADKLSPAELQANQQAFRDIQIKLETYGQQKEQELLLAQDAALKKIKDELKVVMDALKDELGLDYILTYDNSNFIQTANESYDISEAAVKMLNENHPKSLSSEDSVK